MPLLIPGRKALIRSSSPIRQGRLQVATSINNATRIMSSSLPSAPTSFAVHSSYRDGNNCKLKPNGLEWDLPGLSEICYVPYPPVNNHESGSGSTRSIDVTSPRVRRGVVEAHNRWSFAKDLPFVRVDDIAQLLTFKLGDDDDQIQYITARWKPNRRAERIERHFTTVAQMLESDAAAKMGTNEADTSIDTSAEVWLNGTYISTLSGPPNLPPILNAINSTTLQSKKVCYRRSNGIIRIERYFRGMIRGVEVFDHLMDNLYAMEDAELVGEGTIVGTVTLPDWIMGGMLSSRLWVRELDNGNVLTMRPLQNDDLGTSDRRYELVKGEDDDWIALVREELKRLRYLATMGHPVDRIVGRNAESDEKKEHKKHTPTIESAVARQHRINKRRHKMRL